MNEFPIIKRLAGILHVSSKSVIKTGITKVGICRREFTPFIKNLPKIFVKTNRLNTAPDEYVVVKFEKIEGEVMYYEVDIYLGQIGGYELELMMIKNIASCHWTNKHNKNFINLTEIDCSIGNSRLDITDQETNIFTIDPIGCEDIDDALQIVKYKDYYEVRIHITDVSSYIEESSVYDKELEKRVETIYYNNKDMNVMHMIPQTFSLNILSLKEGTAKRVFSVIIKINFDYEIIEVNFRKMLINIKKNLSYEEAQDLINNSVNPDLNNLYNVGFELKNKIAESFDKLVRYDVHQMVEVYMIYANKLVAEYIANYDNDNVILRSQKQTPNNKINSDEIDPIILLKNRINKLEKAQYQIGTKNCEHSELKLKYYTHFTSPMRRYVDILVHRQLEKCLNGIPLKPIENEKLQLINFYRNVYKKVERYSYLIEILNNLNEVNEYYGTITSFGNGDNLRIYIKEINLDLDCQIINDKFKHLMLIENNEEKIEITNISENIKIQFLLFDTIKIRFAKLEKSIDKIETTIIEPDIYFILGLG